MQPTPLTTWAGKRALDIAVSVVGLLAAAPFMVLIGLAVRLDTRGPILFRQTRIGLAGVPFEILKFRTMINRPSVSDGAITLHGDQRITRTGHFLRHWKLDELPQLWNVLRGDMSLVGPRPEVPQYVAIYPADMRKLVLGVRPGITDTASVKYRSESEMLAGMDDPDRFYREVILPDKLALAADYARNVSLANDFRILFSTIMKVVRDK